MTAPSTRPSRPCDAVREAIELHDDAAPAPVSLSGVEAHLAGCPQCAAFREDLREARLMTAQLPFVPFPDDALEAVWAETIERPPLLRRRLSPARWLAMAAAAAVILVAGLTLKATWRPAPAGPKLSEAELAELDRQVQQVLLLVSHTLRRTERVTVNEILVGEAAPSLRVLPLDSPDDGGPSHEMQ